MLKVQIILLIGILTLIKGSEVLDYGQPNLQDEFNKAEVELLIVCDVECSERFQNNREKLIDYWSVYMWDVNMRFKTLRSVDISFRVTAILGINKTEDQPFVEEARLSDGTIMLKPVWSRFSEWVFTNEKNVPGFDVALLITGAQQAESDAYLAYEESDFGSTACLKDNKTNMHLSTIVLHSTATWGYHCAALEAALAEMFGAQYDAQTDCKYQDYLMTSGKCNNNQYAFSKCSDESISTFLKSPQAACVYTSEAPEVDVLSEASVTHGPSLNDQCAMITNNNNAVALSGEKEYLVGPCVISKCSVFENDNWIFLRSLFPVDNSLCGGGNICFRGRCLPQGVQLRNVGTGDCLHPNKKLGEMKYPNMVECTGTPTPLDQVRVVAKDENTFGKYLATPTTVPSLDARDQDECLSNFFDFQNSSHLEYNSCLTTDEEYIGWDLVDLGKGNDEFLMLHRFTNSCARVDPDGIIRLYKNCSHEDLRVQWTTVNQPLIPLNVLGSSIHATFEEEVEPQQTHQKQDDLQQEEQWYSSEAASTSFRIFAYVGIVCVCALALFSVRRYMKNKRSSRSIPYEALRF